MLCDEFRGSVGLLAVGEGAAAILLQVGAPGCELVVRRFLMSSVFASIFDTLSELVVLVDASQATRSSLYYLDRIEVGTSRSCLPPLIISSPLVVIFCISLMILISLVNISL
jgi:hypothetical protein